MYKSLIILYIVCLGLYVLFSRQPDYFDGQFATGTIHFIKDSSGENIAKAFFNIDKKNYSFNPAYTFRIFTEGESIKIIYDTSQPSKAALYSIWGYWLKWGELLFTIGVLIVLFQVAVAINKNPTPEALIEQLEYKTPKKTKYDP